MDEYLRQLQRRARQGDPLAQKELLQYQARMRGYPIGPWDDPKWYKDFVEGARNVQRWHLIDGQCVYISSSAEGPWMHDILRPVNLHRIYWQRPSYHPHDFAHDVKGSLLLDFATQTTFGQEGFHVDGFLVVFSGEPNVLFRTILYPFGDRYDILDTMHRLYGKAPMAEARFNHNDEIVLEPLRPHLY